MASLSQMGIPSGGFGILHPKQKHKWEVTFVGLARLVPGISGREITRQAVSMSLPNLTFEEVTLHRYNSVAYVAGKHSWDSINITVEDDITGLAAAAINGQLETQQRLIGGDLPGQWLNSAATGSDYKFGVIFKGLDGNEAVTETWKLEGCWIVSRNAGDRSYDDSGAATIEMTLRFDHARHELSGAGFGTALNGNL